jgi:hypothetical protein
VLRAVLHAAPPTVDLLTQQAAGGQGGAISPDVTKAVYALAAASGSETAYKALRQMYEEVRLE